MTISLLSIFIFAILISATHFLHHTAGEPHEWALYYAALVSALLSSLLTLAVFTKDLELRISNETIKRTGVFLLILAIAILPWPRLNSAALIGLLVGVSFVFFALRLYRERWDKLTWLLMILLSVFAWKICYRAVWWEPSQITYDLTHFRSSLVFFATLALVLSANWKTLVRIQLQKPDATQGSRVLDLFAVGVLAFGCTRPYRLQAALLHHQGFYVGPLDLIKQGGHLLWNVPSQYGFLNLLFASKFNIGTTWQSLMTLHRLFVFVSAVIVYYALTLVWSSRIGRVFSLVLTFLALLFWSGSAENLSGPMPYPSVAAFRFTWCYFLLALCIYLCHKSRNVGALKSSPLRWVGHLFWGFGLLWSSESAVYSTAIWLTFNFILNLQVAQQDNHLNYWQLLTRGLLPTLKLLAWPIFIYSAVSLYYLIDLGHFPDWHSFYEYALLYKNGYGALPIDIHGGVWAILSLFIFSTLAFNSALFQKSKYAPCSGAALIAFWAVSSYFVSRSHENNVSTLVPLFLFFFALILKGFLDVQLSKKVMVSVFLITIPFTQVIIEGILNHKMFLPILKEYAQPDLVSTHFLYDRTQDVIPEWIDNLKGLQSEIQKLKIQNAEAVVFYDEYLGQLPQDAGSPNYWIPFAPGNEFEILPSDRKAIYLKRFAEEKKMGGWIISKKYNPDLYKKMVQLVLVDYIFVEKRVDGDWLAEKFKPR